MTTEQRINNDLKDCTYELLKDSSNTKLWERKCIHDHIDYVVGARWFKEGLPSATDFETRSRNMAFRFIKKEDAEIFYDKINK